MKVLRFCTSRLAVLVAVIVAVLFAPSFLRYVGLLAMGATTTAFNAGGASDINQALKIFFNEPVAEDIVYDSELLALLEEDNNVKQDETTGGRYIETAQYFQLPAGVGARAENEYIPVADGPVIQNSRVFLKKIQGVLEMTGDVMRRVKGDLGAYLNWAERAMPDLVKRVDHELDRMLFGYGNGALARVNALPDGTHIDVDRNFGVGIVGNITVAAQPAWLNFLEGMRIVYSANANGSPLRNAGAGQSSQVTAVNPALGVFGRLTVDVTPAGVAVNDYIFPGDAAGASSQDATGTDREVEGLLGCVDDGTILATFQNLARGTFLLFNSIVIDGSAVPFNGLLTEDLLIFADDETFTKGMGKPDAIITSRSGARAYWKSLKGDRVYPNPRSYQGGFGEGADRPGKFGLSVVLGDRDVPIKACRKCPTNFTFGLQLDTFKRWTLGGWQWDDTTGAVWNRVTDATGRKDAYFAVGNIYMQVGDLAPRKSFRINNLSLA
ncbi:MAG TPA: phage major capsid protein [Gemmatimonadales bacterium]|nr:phage major capsid protein [Gemmatimonadales bacterium]